MTNLRELPKENIDWRELGFDYIPTEFRFVATYKNGTWSKGELVTNSKIQLHEGSPALHYGQQCFEGMKAQTAKDGRILLFRPDLNAERMQQSSTRLSMASVPTELFLHGVAQAVRANYRFIPPYGSGAVLYVRPLLIGTGENLGLRPAPEYEFRVFVSPVGPYYKGDGLSLIKLAVTDYDRAAPCGTGAVKAGGNYAGGFLATKQAKELGANEALYLDSETKTYLEEAGSANIVVSLAGSRLITPHSPTILPSITRRSIMQIAQEELGMTTEERPIHLLNEFKDFEEMGACGTAAVISPVQSILYKNEWIHMKNSRNSVGPVMQGLYNSLTQLQKGEREDPYNWTVEVEI